MTTLQERIHGGMSEQERADAAALDVRIHATETLLASLRKQRAALGVSDEDRVPILTLDAHGFIPPHQIDELLIDSSDDTQIVSEPERAALLAGDEYEAPERWDGGW